MSVSEHPIENSDGLSFSSKDIKPFDGNDLFPKANKPKRREKRVHPKNMRLAKTIVIIGAVVGLMISGVIIASLFITPLDDGGSGSEEDQMADATVIYNNLSRMIDDGEKDESIQKYIDENIDQLDERDRFDIISTYAQHIYMRDGLTDESEILLKKMLEAAYDDSQKETALYYLVDIYTENGLNDTAEEFQEQLNEIIAKNEENLSEE